MSSSLLAYLYICIMILPNMQGIDIVLPLKIVLSSDEQSLIPQDCSSQSKNIKKHTPHGPYAYFLTFQAILHLHFQRSAGARPWARVTTF